MKGKLKAVILRNEIPDDHLLWVRACEFFRERLQYRIVDLTGNDWLEMVQSESFDVLLAKPPALNSFYKELYDERIYILAEVLKYKVFPSAAEIFIYENKRLLSYWLEANKIPHPKTDIFYSEKRAINFLENKNFPIVAKSNIGACGSGVFILRNAREALNYIKQTFNGKSVPRRLGPNLAKGGLLKRGLHYIFHPSDISKKLQVYKIAGQEIQKGLVIFQEYIAHDYEWRAVRIGDSFFAHKKIKIGQKASGTELKEYCNPPLKLLDFVKAITDKYQFYSQAIDIFETAGQGYLVNEMQCLFGQSDSYQMLVNGEIGRYIFIENDWVFEKGDFNRNESYNLRIEHILKVST